MKRIILVIGIIISCLVISCKYDNIVFKGTSSHLEIPRNSTHEDLGTDYYKETYPFDCAIIYPEDDKCGILN